MWFKKKIIIAETQKGLLFKEQQFIKVLPAGVHKFWDWFDQYQVQIVTLTNTLQEEMSKDLLHIAQLHSEAFAEGMTQWGNFITDEG